MHAESLELEITGRCQLTCRHCFAGSGQRGTHGTLTTRDWQHIITDAAALGIPQVQLIGGEPTTHPGWIPLLEHALNLGRRVEIFSNLFHVQPAWWELFTRPGVTLATSYYSDMPAEHDSVTGRRGSHARTRANIAEAVRRSIPLRAGIVDVLDGQRVDQARAELLALGVNRVGTDRTRQVGRAAHSGAVPDVTELCGRCGRGRAAISPAGDVWPCVLSRWLCAGNVRKSPLGEILDGSAMRELVATIPAPARATACNPDSNGDDCRPAETDACKPKY